MLRNCNKTLRHSAEEQITFLKACEGFQEVLKMHISVQGVLNFYPSYRYAAAIQKYKKDKAF